MGCTVCSQINTKPVLRSGCRDNSVCRAGRGIGCAANWGTGVTIRATHILIGKERTEIQAFQVTSDVFSTGILSADFNNTGFQA